MSLDRASNRLARLGAAPVAAVLVAVMVVAGCASRPSPTPSSGAPGQTECNYPSAGAPSRPVDPPSSTGVETEGIATATLQFPDGPIELTMDRAHAPCTVHSFVSLAQQGFFTGTTCHRLTDQGIFVLQCGDPTGTGTGGPGYTIPDELTGSETYPPGTVAMANRGQPDTGGSQFFLVWQDSPLPAQYTVFGSLDAEGLEVLGRMASQGVAAGTESPIADTTISDVTLG